jgi:hypothetical protein
LAIPADAGCIGSANAIHIPTRCEPWLLELRGCQLDQSRYEKARRFFFFLKNHEGLH